METVCKKEELERSLKPELRLERRGDGQLWASAGEKQAVVSVARCFPWSSPGRYISLRDDEREEFWLVNDPAELDDGSRQALELALLEAGFLLDIVAIDAVEEEIEIRNWRVRTQQGARRFQTRRDDWPRRLPGGGVLVRDVAGDLYCVRDPARLDASSRERLSVFVD